MCCSANQKAAALLHSHNQLTYDITVSIMELLNTISVIIFLLLRTQLTLGCLQLNGQDISLPATTSSNTRVSNGFSSKDHGVTPSLQFTCSGRVDQWDAYFERRGTCFVRFQVWRPTRSPQCTTGGYTLVGTNIFNNYQVDNTLRGQFVPSPDDVIEFQPGDIVGYYVEFQGRRDRRVSFQTAAVSGTDSFYKENIQRDDVPDILSFDTCSSLVRSDAVPLLSATVTEDVTTTQAPITTELLATTVTPTPTQSTTEVATTPTQSTTEVATTLTQSTTEIVTTTLPPSTTSSPDTTTVTTMDSTTQAVTNPELVTTRTEEIQSSTGTSTEAATETELIEDTTTSESTTGVLSGSDSVSGGLNHNNTQSTSTAPMSEEAIPLTTLILAVVVAFVVSAVLVVTTIILFRCVWVRLRRRKTRRLDLSSPDAHHKRADGHVYSYEVSAINPVALSEDKLKMADDEPYMYEVPCSTLKPNTPRTAMFNQPSLTKRPLPPVSLKEDFENTYEVPTGSRKISKDDRNTSFGARKLPPTKDDRVYSNASFSVRKLSSTDYALPPLPVESEYMTPQNTLAIHQEEEDYCNVNSLDGKIELRDYEQELGGLTESNVYEELPL